MRATTGPWQLWKKSPLPGLAELRLIGRPGAGLRALAVSPGPGIAASRPGTRPQSSRAPPRSTWNSRRRTRGPRPIARRLQPALWRLLFSDPAGRRCPCGAGGRAAARADRSPAPADAAAPPERGVHDLAPNQIRRRPHRRRPKKARTDDRDPESRGLPPQAAFLVITHNPTYYWAGARIPVSLEEGRVRPGVLLVRAGSLFNSDLFFDWRLWLGVALSIVAVSALCWVPFIRGLTLRRPDGSRHPANCGGALRRPGGAPPPR